MNECVCVPLFLLVFFYFVFCCIHSTLLLTYFISLHHYPPCPLSSPPSLSCAPSSLSPRSPLQPSLTPSLLASDSDDCALFFFANRVDSFPWFTLHRKHPLQKKPLTQHFPNNCPLLIVALRSPGASNSTFTCGCVFLLSG